VSAQENQMKLSLNNGAQVPAVGFGTYMIQDGQAQVCVREALKAGYRHIDTAEGYRNEAGVGRALKGSGIARDDLFVTTKLWPGRPTRGRSAKDRAATIASCDRSLSKLGLDHVDLYLIHAPFAGPQRLEQWEALLELQRQGKVRAIGVSNFNQAHLEEIAAAGLPMPDANQIELHPWSQKPALTTYLADKGIATIAYSSLVPLAQWRAVEGQKSAKTDAMRQDGADPGSPFKAMAAKYAVTEAQVLLRWGVQVGYAVLPKSVNPERIRQNIDLFSFELDAQDMAAIAGMDRGAGVAWASGDPTVGG
jgi:2,5-diketo-D-gluconate reductase A